MPRPALESEHKGFRAVKQWLPAIVVAFTLTLDIAARAQQDDVARELERQTQELLNAVSAGDARLGSLSRYECDLSPRSRRPHHRICRSPRRPRYSLDSHAL